MWRLIFLFILFLIIFLISYPFLIKTEIKLNILRLKGVILIKLFNKFKFEIKFRVKNGYIYFYYNNKERKEKISGKNINLRFLLILIQQIYFRQQIINLNLISNFGYLNDSCVTATVSGYVLVLTQNIFAKIKNNKKSAHISVDVTPKYNEDICNLRLTHEVRMSGFDSIYALVCTITRFGRDYERDKKRKEN